MRELFGECLVHLANGIPKPGGGCIFGGTLPGGSLGKSLKVTPLSHSNKAIWPVGPMCVKLCYSQCENVHLSAFQRTGGKWEIWQHFCPAREPLMWAIQPSFPDQSDPGTGQEFVAPATLCLRPRVFTLENFQCPHFEPVNLSSERRYYNDADTQGVRNSQQYAQRVTEVEEGVGKQSLALSVKRAS